jgi:hypothetical protein
MKQIQPFSGVDPKDAVSRSKKQGKEELSPLHLTSEQIGSLRTNGAPGNGFHTQLSNLLGRQEGT